MNTQMTKRKDTFKIDNCDTLEVFKHARSNKWSARFYVGRHISKSGNFTKSTKTDSKQLAIKIAKEMWRDYFFTNPQDKDVPIEQTFHSIALNYFEHQMIVYIK